MKVSYSIHHLPFKHPFTISKGTKTHQPTFVVALEHFGIVGYGEAPAISYYNIPVEKMEEDLLKKKNFVEKFAFTDPERYWHYLHHLIPNNNFWFVHWIWRLGICMEKLKTNRYINFGI